MAESITISSSLPALKSMQYEFLREEGLKYIEELASKIWTDYNESDPGITILEVLSYAITDLGYRSSYSIEDLLAANPNLPEVNIKNFYTAREILPISPVTFNDYRKLLIDVEVHDPLNPNCSYAGVKNAWIEKAPENEIPIFLDGFNDKLDYSPIDPGNPEQLDLKVLYNILLEFDQCPEFGDLNENTIEGRTEVYNICPSDPLDPELSGMSIDVQVEFAYWDDDIDWSDTTAIKMSMKSIVLDFSQLPTGYTVQQYGLDSNNDIELVITKGVNQLPVNTTCIVQQLAELVYNGSNPNNFLIQYQNKINKILEIVNEVRKKLMANRNLCEDFYQINALKVEEIALCADIIVDTNSNIDEILAQIYFEIGNFLSPTIYFHTLAEMYDLGYGTEEIFEGPPLEHGFIDTEELTNGDRKESIHVSDLINIIMDIPGVQAINDLQIANIPLDNTDNIPSKSVKWCLQLAFDKNYVPRLSTERSSITFIKEQLPYTADESKVDELLEQLISQQPPQKLHNIQLDLPVPEGTFRDIENYFSIQEEFPLVYGIGSEGLSNKSTEERKAQAKQLKAFLLFFDQLLADYLAQLNNVKNLFSMNGEKDSNGNYVIDKTYYTQSLVPYVPDITPLLKDEINYPTDLQELAEDPEEFDERRNRFLDHLMARFSEQFTDYALLVYKLNGQKSSEELLEDKLRFLDEYPTISGDRFKAFNYESPCKIWHTDNVSGLERRISLLTGINPLGATDLVFPENFVVTGSAPTYGYQIDITSSLFLSTGVYETEDDALKGMEEFIINAVDPEKLIITDEGGGNYSVSVICNETSLAQVTVSGLAAAQDLVQSTLDLMSQQYYDNAESNLHNLACPLDNYFSCFNKIEANMVPNPPVYYFMFELFEKPFNFNSTNDKLLTGSDVSADNVIGSVPIADVVPANFEIIVNGNITSQLDVSDSVEIVGSDDNDGIYTIDSISLDYSVESGTTSVIVLAGSPVLTTDIPLGDLEFTIKTAYKGYGDCKSEENIVSVDFGQNTVTLSGDLSPWININDPISIVGSLDNDGDYTVFNVTVNIISPSEKETVIELTEALTSSSVPYGKVQYNLLTEEEFVESISKEKILFEIVQLGLDSDNYGFTDYTLEPYKFFVKNHCDEALAYAIEENYNEDLTQAIISAGTIEIVSSSANDGTYSVLTGIGETEVQGAQIKVEISGALPSPIADGQLEFDGSSTSITAILDQENKIELTGNLSRILINGDQFTIVNSTVNNGTYTIAEINYDLGVDTTTITVNETLQPEVSPFGDIEYTKSLDIKFINIGPNGEIFVKGGADDFAVYQMTQFFKNKFFSHEGLHILEHILLRPKYNEEVYLDFNNGGKPLDNSIAILGDLSYMKKLPVASVDLTDNEFLVAGDITAELIGLELSTIYIEGSQDGTNDGAYSLLSFFYNGSETEIKVFESIPATGLIPEGDFIYPQTVAISNIPTTTSVEIPVAEAEISESFPFTIGNSEDGINDGNYQSLQLNPISASVTEVVFESKEMKIQDKLLPVNLLEDCFQCSVDDPYSFIMTVVLPAWQGRFTNQDFRAFFERSFRLECPAHLVPNICWISCEQMSELENAYKKWLIENEKVDKIPIQLSAALNELIDVLTSLRSVYPVGTLHDCAVDDTTDNAIILDRTELGTI